MYRKLEEAMNRLNELPRALHTGDMTTVLRKAVAARHLILEYIEEGYRMKQEETTIGD